MGESSWFLTPLYVKMCVINDHFARQLLFVVVFLAFVPSSWLMMNNFAIPGSSEVDGQRDKTWLRWIIGPSTYHTGEISLTISLKRRILFFFGPSNLFPFFCVSASNFSAYLFRVLQKCKTASRVRVRRNAYDKLVRNTGMEWLSLSWRTFDAHFDSDYFSKTPGTHAGINEPVAAAGLRARPLLSPPFPPPPPRLTNNINSSEKCNRRLSPVHRTSTEPVIIIMISTHHVHR